MLSSGLNMTPISQFVWPIWFIKWLKPVSAKFVFSFEISMVSLTNYIYLQTNKETIIERPEQPGFRASYAKQQTNIVSFPT